MRTPGAPCLLALCALACAAPDDPAPPAFLAGSVRGTDAVVAVVRDGAHVTAYVCGGATDYGAVTRWFEGSAAPGEAVEITRDGATLRLDAAAPGAASVAGAVTDAQGVARPFVVRLQPSGTAAGLYDNADDGCRAGAVVWLPEGASEPSAQGAWCDRDGLVEQVEPVRPLLVDAAGLRARLGPRAGLRAIRLRAVVR